MKDQESILAEALALVSRAGDRQGIRAHMADRDGDDDLALLLRAFGESTGVVVSRLRMLRRGKVEAGEQGQADLAREEAEALARVLARMAEDEAGERPAGPVLEHCALVAGRLAGLLNGDEPQGPFLVCRICGYVARGQAPERCPVCGAVPDKFKPVE